MRTQRHHQPEPGRSRLSGTALLSMLLLVLGMLATSASAQGSAASNEITFPNGIQGHVSVSPDKGIVGTQATLTGSGFEPGASLDVVWSAFKGEWKLEMKNGEYDGNFLGRQFQENNVTLASVTVGSDGSFSAPFTVPEGFGGNHDVYVVENGTYVNKAGFYVQMHATMSPDSGPVGTDITVTVTGIDDINNIAGWYALTYDNTITGFMTAVTTHGTAHMVIPATGRVGTHVIELRNSPFDAPYLALKFSPYSFLPEPQFLFKVTDGAPVLPKPIAEQAPAPTPGAEPSGSGPRIWVNPVAAIPGAPSHIYGAGLPANTKIDLGFTDMSGSRVTTSLFTGTLIKVGSVTTDASGAFTLPFPIPDQHGGGHQLLAQVGKKVVASTDFTIDSEGLPLEPAKGPVGTHIMLHLKGIGWTQTTNIFAVVIDNTYLGYGCGFSTDGDVKIPLTASWAPGWHFIDIYPSFYRNKDYEGADEQPFLYRQAILTWKDHPHKIHFRYAFYVTGDAGTQAGN
jgi:hypothetical protein